MGDRYYVTSKSLDALGPNTALKVCRAHWRCENNTHWTADAELMEDRRQPAWSRHPQGSLAAGAGRVVRGGSWSSKARYCRSACRYWDPPDDRGGGLGFRPARVQS